MSRLAAELQDRYRIESEIGSGGMATVFRARDIKHDREVALKVLRPELAAVLGAERFLNEIAITARLDHPHILTLIDSGSAHGFLYYVLPFVRGESLRDRLRRDRQLPLDDVISITKDIGAALEYAHRHGVIHRDVKPENILIHEGEAVLADFGIALAVREAGGERLTQSGLSLGTPQYMSPEQAMGDRTLDARSDEYSLAAVVYEMLVGEPPQTGPNLQVIIAKLLTQRPVAIRTLRETVPISVATAVEKGLAKLPADRFASVDNFVKAMTTPPADERDQTQFRSWAPLAIGGALAALTIVGIYALVSAGKSRADDSPSMVVGKAALPSPVSPPVAPTSSSTNLPAPASKPAPRNYVAEADSARARALDTRRNAIAAGIAATELAPGDARLDAAEALFRNGRADAAIKRLDSVASDWNNLIRSRRKARTEIESLIDDYARAVAWRDPKRMHAAFPDLTAPQQGQWDEFFKNVRAVTAELNLTDLHVAADTAYGDLKGTYGYIKQTGQSEKAPVVFSATFKYVGGKWTMKSVR
jgi:serine/threonine protein kinase